jgi:putative protease
MDGVRIGEVTHFYSRVSVAVLVLTDKLSVGDTVHILGRTTDLRQKIHSLQIEHESVEEAGPGQDVALKVDRRVRTGDTVYKIAETDEG